MEGEQRGTDFFIGEMAAMSEAYERRFNALSKRVNELEEKNRGHLEDDPLRTIFPFIAIAVTLQFLPLIADMVTKWRSRSSSE